MSNIPIAERVKWIGASEAAILLGASPFGTPYTLYHTKAGNIPAEDLDDNERVQAGQYLEPAIGAWAAKKWAWPLENVAAYIPHPSVAQFGCSLDFATGDGDPVELKNVDGLVFRDKWDAEGDTILDAPAHYLIQVQAQLACAGKDHGWLVACVGGNKLYRMKIERHPGVIARIEQEVADFWESIREGREPRPDFDRDGAAISTLYSISNGAWLDLMGNSHVPELCSAYKAGKAQEKAGKNAAAAAAAEIKAIIGEASGASCEGFIVKFIDVKESVVEEHTRKPYRKIDIKESAQ